MSPQGVLHHVHRHHHGQPGSRLWLPFVCPRWMLWATWLLCCPTKNHWKLLWYMKYWYCPAVMKSPKYPTLAFSKKYADVWQSFYSSIYIPRIHLSLLYLCRYLAISLSIYLFIIHPSLDLSFIWPMNSDSSLKLCEPDQRNEPCTLHTHASPQPSSTR